MKRRYFQSVAIGAALTLVAAACASAPRQSSTTSVGRPMVDARSLPREVLENAEANRNTFTPADVHFMSGMIPHHAQAVQMARWAPTHDAGKELRTLCERIVVGQGDEIALMRGWLQDRGQPVPAADATHLKMKMGGMDHDMLMPGMLTPEQLVQLDRARGPEFDRLFIRFMIQHHEGAIAMVDELYAAPGAMHDDIVFKLAADIYADQTTEIEHMTKMLDRIPSGADAR